MTLIHRLQVTYQHPDHVADETRILSNEAHNAEEETYLRLMRG